ncbi:MAG: sigma 54-interacting transcriptional regulator [Candidatus Cloacimonadales bacterium]|nr:sigma 54-interacting transcriptional regulator [Candidatus Cloacimonadales bacterium]
MEDRIVQMLSNFITNDQTLVLNIYTKLQHKQSKIIEIVGEPGSGKTFFFRQLLEKLSMENKEAEYCIPQLFRFNQFEEIVQLTTDINKSDFNELIAEAEKLGIKQKYDLFYFLTEKMTERKILKPKTIILYETSGLDQYSLDFIQYLVQYSEDVPIQFVLFTCRKTFSFSEKVIIPKPTQENLQKILSNLFPDSKNDYYSESEILENITKGNMATISYVLFHSIKSDKKKIDFSAFLDKKLSIKNIIRNNIETFNEKQQTLYYTILLLDTFASDSTLKKIFGQTAFTKDLNFLKKQSIIYMLNGKYHSKKTVYGKDFFAKLSAKKQDEIYQNVSKVLTPEHLDDLRISIKKYDPDTILRIVNRISKLFDYDANVKLYKLLMEMQISLPEQADAIKNLGKAYHNLGKYDIASEYYRRALRICVENNLPLDEIVMELARSLKKVGSSAYALEIIKKYTPEPKDKIVEYPLLLLKIEILMDLEEFDDAKDLIDKVYRIADQNKDEQTRYNIMAECRKLRGKIYYFLNDWVKAESEFNESEKFYLKVNNLEGLSAIYNNLGALASYRGESKVAETLMLKSLNLDKQRYNLNGVSVSYNNMGSMFEDTSDYKKCLKYFNEAIRIQKLLGGRTVIANLYNNIGITYMNNAEYDKAEESYRSSLKIGIEFNLYIIVVSSYSSLGAMYFRAGDFTKAIDYYERAVKKSKEHNLTEGLCQNYNNIGELFEKRGEYNLAYDFYLKSKELLPVISNDFLRAELFGNLGSVLTQLHQFKEAYAYLVESSDYFKSLDAKDKILEGAQKHAIFFISTRNFESANYYLDQALKLAEELENEFQIGKCYYIRALMEKDETDKALDLLKKAKEKFVKTNNNFELAMANFEYAELLLIKEDWEQALQILNDNKKIIQKFEAIKFLEKNDILIQKINTKYEKELKESKVQESMLNKFYEITQQLNVITDFDILLEIALDKLVDFAEADSGIFALYNNKQLKDSWDYLLLNNFSNQDIDFPILMDLVQQTYNDGISRNHKQPHFAPQYNNIITYPLTVRNEKKGVICLFTKRGNHYFTEKTYNLISALCNQIVVIVENISYEKLQKAHEIIREELAESSTFTNIIGKSEKIQEIFRMIEKIKNATTTVLLEGTSGTGKELIARAIHYNSNRRNNKFVAQYCGALPETLLESELFGHMKGSFTGATHDKKGLFEIADGGTFFLDEIADISLSTQVKLLRFLQEGEIKRVGSTNTQHVDVRVICATNVSLREKVERGEFRLDLFYRLNVIRIEVPPLKERKSDIPLLAVHFLDKYCSKMNKSINGITEEAMKYLMNYDWPGNIRQLENEIERAVTLSEGESSIRSSELSEEIFRFQEHTETVNLLEKRSLKDAVEKLEKQMIISVLDETDWNQTQAAKKLGLSRQGLIKKMQRYKLER